MFSSKKQIVVELIRPVFLCRQDINASPSKFCSNRRRNMMIHEQTQAQGKRPLARNLRRVGDIPRLAWICATSRRPLSISRSSSS